MTDGVRKPDIVSPFLSVREAAIYLRLSERALENFRAVGGGPEYRKHGHRVVYEIKALDAWSYKRRFLSSSERGDE